jgi:hypothetical protein
VLSVAIGAHGFNNVSVAFTPASTGALSATLTITDSGNTSPQSVKMAGTSVNETHRFPVAEMKPIRKIVVSVVFAIGRGR